MLAGGWRSGCVRRYTYYEGKPVPYNRRLGRSGGPVVGCPSVLVAGCRATAINERIASVRFSKGLLLAGLGLVATGVVGCTSSSGSGLPPSVSSPSSAPAETRPVPAQPRPAEPETKAGAWAAAEYYYRLYLASQFAASWDLLAPAARQQIPQRIWVGVHNGCLSASAGTARVIKSVTVFVTRLSSPRCCRALGRSAAWRNTFLTMLTATGGTRPVI